MRRIVSLMAVLVLAWLPVLPAAVPQKPAGIDYKLQSQELTVTDEKPGYEAHSEPERALEEYEQISDEELEKSQHDYYLLARLAMAEAESEGLFGKAAVVKVVLNRVDSPYFPDSVKGVIFQPGQFSSVSDGRWDAVEPDEECYVAVQAVFEGWTDAACEGATYFTRWNPSGWHHRALQYIGRMGAHAFYN